MERRRVIVGGLPRSGSTLIRFILDRSEELISGPETGFFIQPLWQRQDRSERVSERLSSILDLDASRIRSAIEGASDAFEAFDGIMDLYGESLRVAKGGWAEKTPTNCFHYPFLAAQRDDVHFVSVIRNGLDVVTSGVEGHPKRTGYWCSIQRYVDSMAAIYAFDHPLHVIVRYEDVVRDPIATVKELFSFLGCTFHESLLQPDEESPPSRNLEKVNQPKLAFPVQDTSIERWRDERHRDRVNEFMSHPAASAWLERSSYRIDI